MFFLPSFPVFFCRYQYYLQVKKEVLDGRLQCSVEQGIRLAGLAVQGKTTRRSLPMRDRQHVRVSTNSHFLRSSWLHYLIWLHTTGRTQSTWVPMVSVLTHAHTHTPTLAPSFQFLGAVCVPGECKQTACLSAAPRLAVAASGRLLSVGRWGSCARPPFARQTAESF